LNTTPSADPSWSAPSSPYPNGLQFVLAFAAFQLSRFEEGLACEKKAFESMETHVIATTQGTASIDLVPLFLLLTVFFVRL
jgi:hypothetical protein